MPTLIFAESDWWTAVAGGLALAAAIGIVSGAVAIVFLARDMRTYVLPWFLPSPPGEEDVSLPAQVARLSAATTAVNLKVENHMSDEVAVRLEDMADRDRRQSEMDAWRDEVRDDIASIKSTQATKEDIRTVHRRIDTALARLALGNPELRPVPPMTIPTPVEFDAHTAPEWSRMAAEVDVSGEVVVDMAATELCDSSGLGALVHLAQRTEIAGGSFEVENMSAAIVRSIRILSLGAVLGIE